MRQVRCLHVTAKRDKDKGALSMKERLPVFQSTLTEFSLSKKDQVSTVGIMRLSTKIGEV